MAYSHIPDTSPAKILLVEDDPMLQKALLRLLASEGFDVTVYIGAETMLAELTQMLHQHKHLLLLIDLKLEGMDGVDAQKMVRQHDADLPVILMSAQQDARKVNEAWRDGAKNFLFKPFTPKELLDAIKDALQSRPRSLPPISTALLRNPDLDQRVNTLTHRQRQVLVLLARGMTHDQIAERIGISPRTVKLHRVALMQRLQCKHLTDLVRVHDAFRLQLAQAQAQTLT